MLYDETRQRGLIDRFISGAVLLFEQCQTHENEEDLLTRVGEKLILSIFNLKHPAFRGEDEWRVLMLESFNNPQPPVHYRVSGSRIIPYIELQFGADWVSRIVTAASRMRSLSLRSYPSDDERFT
jgi:hypothetical protein